MWRSSCCSHCVTDRFLILITGEYLSSLSAACYVFIIIIIVVIYSEFAVFSPTEILHSSLCHSDVNRDKSVVESEHYSPFQPVVVLNVGLETELPPNLFPAETKSTSWSLLQICNPSKRQLIKAVLSGSLLSYRECSGGVFFFFCTASGGTVRALDTVIRDCFQNKPQN